ncbi:MAG: CsgG/HfaB family protein [bacterium]
MNNRTYAHKNTARLLAIVFLITGASLVGTATGDERADSKLEQAAALYRKAHFDEAIQLLQELAADATLPKQQQTEVWKFLSRTYYAKHLHDQARNAISKLLELEPPLITLDPDREPPPLMDMYYEVRKEKNKGSRVIEQPDPGIKTMAILDFKNRSPDDKERFDPMEQGFADLMIHQLNGSTRLVVVERERIQWILKEIELENEPDRFDPDMAVRIGKQLGVHIVLFGSFINLNNQMWLGARLVKVETSEVLLTDSVRGKTDKFFDLTSRLGRKISKKIEVEISSSSRQEEGETESLDAVLLYSQGLRFLEDGDYQKAYQKFQDALKRDPDYDKARKRAESIKPLLG